MRTRSGVPLVLAFASSMACTQGPSTRGTEDFVVDVRNYNWEIGGWDMIRVDAEGQAESIYARGIEETWPLDEPNAAGETEQKVLVPHWFSVEWSVTPEQLRELQRVIDKSRFFGRRELYEDPTMHDGITTAYHVTAAGEERVVTCKNRCPRKVEAIQEALQGLDPARAGGPVTGERELSKDELVERGLIPRPPD